MALSAIPGDLEAKAGTQETIKIVPSKFDPATDINIVQVLYGSTAAGPTAVPPDASNSFTLTIQPSVNRLQVTLFSPDPVDGSAAAQQSSGGVITTLAQEIDFVSGVAVWVQDIDGV